MCPPVSKPDSVPVAETVSVSVPVFVSGSVTVSVAGTLCGPLTGSATETDAASLAPGRTGGSHTPHRPATEPLLS